MMEGAGAPGSMAGLSAPKDRSAMAWKRGAVLLDAAVRINRLQVKRNAILYKLID